jgi:threonine/homoserine/homoserine lactone efflux protein
VLLGLGLAVSYGLSLAGGATGTDRMFTTVAALGSLTLVWFGYQVAYATRHVRLEPDPREE